MVLSLEGFLTALMKDRDCVVTLTGESGDEYTMKADEFFSLYKSQKEKGFTTSKRCIDGIEAVEYFEQFNDHSETFEFAMNRFKYEVAKGIGKKIKHMNAPKAGWHEFNNCGECGYPANTYQNYCPNCGTKYLKNDYTAKKLEEHQVSIEEWLSYGNS